MFTFYKIFVSTFCTSAHMRDKLLRPVKMSGIEAVEMVWKSLLLEKVTATVHGNMKKHGGRMPATVQ